MAEMNVITSMLDDLTQEQPVSTALCIGQHLEQYDHHQTIQWQYFNVTTLLNLPFTQRFDLAFVLLDTEEMADLSSAQKSQLLVVHSCYWCSSTSFWMKAKIRIGSDGWSTV